MHEMAHLLTRRHDVRFVALMDRVMPEWRVVRDRLNRLPVGYVGSEA
jgi:predicted metal-dependent hydrolase